MAVNSSKHIVLSGGGTGGHLFSGIAVAEALLKADPATRITFVGSDRPLERRLLATVGFRYHAIDCRPLRFRPDRFLSFMATHVRAAARARRWLATEQPDVVVGLGGYASIPLARAAAKVGLPLVLLEQNAVAGKANRWLARHAALVCLALDDARASLPRTRGRVLVTGNPVRAGFCSAAAACSRPDQPADHRPLLVVLGGSGGSRQLNRTLPGLLARVGPELAGWRIIHQAGAGQAAAVAQSYAEAGVPSEVVEFIVDMPGMLRSAALALARSGGTTLAELAVAGVPAIVCPWAHAAHDHQRRNALAFERRGACRIWSPQQLDDPHSHAALAQSLAELLVDPSQRTRLSWAMLSVARPRAAQEVAERIHALTYQRRLTPHC